jgi:hypothetical protein
VPPKTTSAKTKAAPKRRPTWESRRNENAAARVWIALSGGRYPYEGITDRHLIHVLLWLRKRAQKDAQRLATKDNVLLGPSGWLVCKPPEWDGLMQEAFTRDRDTFALAQMINAEEFDLVAITAKLKHGRRAV